MGRKILLSFLGNNSYKKCRYITGNFRSSVVRFVQEALVELHQAEWKREDVVYLFLTSAAARNNWEGDLYEKEGLKKALSAHTQLSIEIVKNIPSGISEEEIWDLFEIIYNKIDVGDEVYLDITNGFRSLSMLLMVLLDYAKALKNIQVKKIYYGAFEAISPDGQIEKKFPNPADRLAPLLDLTSFSALQDWTAAATDFKSYGKTTRLSTLTKNSLAPILKDGTGKATAITNLQNINSNVKALVTLLDANRGKALGQFAFNELHQLLADFSTMPSIIKPLTAVVHEMQAKVQHFKEGDPLFWLKSAKWCRDHGMIQQGITQLREGYITWLCFRFQRTIDATLFDFTQAKPRVLITNAFTIAHYDYPKSKWFKVNRDHTPITRALISDPIIRQSTELFISLGTLRHDINHGGYQHYTEASIFGKKLNEFIEELTIIIGNQSIERPTDVTKNGLLNISHHPFEQWKKQQQKVAIEKYGQVMDLPFPNIAPSISAPDFEKLLATYYRKVKAAQPQAVHLMGEPTFTFALVQRLKNAGIPCIASVGERDVEEQGDGQVVRFSFEGFRAY